MRTNVNSLGLLTGITRFLTWIVGIGAMAAVIANLGVLGWLPGTTAGPSCVDKGAQAGQVAAGGTLVCTDSPSAAQRLADMGDQLPTVLFGLGTLFLLLRFLRTASQEGAYAATVPFKLSALGWFLLVGGPLSTLLEAVSRSYLRSTLAVDTPSDWFTEWLGSLPDWSVVAGIAALTFAQILRVGVRMREDLEGTV
jgi:hypothetical protein